MTLLEAGLRPLVLKQGARALAILALLYFLSAFIQTGYVTPLEAFVGVLWLALCYILSRSLGIVATLALSFAGMVLWGIFLESVPVSDYATYYIRAARLISGDLSQLARAKSASTVGYYAAFHWLLGPAYVTNYIASAAAWAGGVAFIYGALRPLVNDEWKARFVCSGLALYPGFFVFSPVVSSESVYFLLSAICWWVISRHLTGVGPFPYLYVTTGVVTAALFLTRSNGLLALVVCLSIFVVDRQVLWPMSDQSATEPAPRRWQHPLVLCAIVLTAFVSVWFAHGYLSWSGDKGFEVTASQWGSVNLLIGTSVHAQGRLNVEDMELAGYTGKNQLPRAEANERAREIAIDRIAVDPVGFMRFALTDKVGQLWDREHALYYWAVGGHYWAVGAMDAEKRQRVRPLVFASLDGVYRLAFFLFLVLLIREVRRPSRLLALGAIALLLALPHVLVEAQPRYHLAMTPFIVVGSMLLVLDFHGRRDEWLPAARSIMQRWLGR